MNKINFTNLPNTTTPLNATNMNLLQTNVEDAITDSVATQLFYDSTASYTSATLSSAITNYDIITVIGQSTDGHQCSTTIYKPAVNDKIGLFAPKINQNAAIYNKQAVYEFTSATVLQSVENHQLQGNTTIQTGNYIKIKAVLGYKV